MNNLIFDVVNRWGKKLHLDFSGKKVRCNGQCLDKFSLGSCMEDVSSKRFYCASVYYDAFTYDELKLSFLGYLQGL